MRTILIVAVIVLATATDSEARGPRLLGRLFGQRVTRTYHGGHSHAPTVQRTGGGHSYAEALASARYRAARGIHGHSYLDTGRGLSGAFRSGVSWSSNPNSRPLTCQGTPTVCVRGRDGVYCTTILR